MKKISIRIIGVFCLVSLVLMALVVFTIADSRIVRDKEYIHSTLLDLENTIEKMDRLKEGDDALVDDSQEEIIREVFEVFSSAQYTIYAVVMKDTGETIALSKNNTQSVIVNDGLEGQEYLELLHRIACGKKTFVTINRSIRLAQAVEGDEYFIVAYKDNSDLVKTLLQEAVIITVFIVICSAFIMFWCYKMMKRYVFDDLEALNRSIGDLLRGNYAVEFQRPQIDELIPLVEAMERFKSVFLHKADRMDRILNVISPDIGAFECLNSTCLNFYSGNLWSILKLSQEEAEHFMSRTEEFKELIHMLMDRKNDKDVVVYQNKHLEVYAYDINGDFIGVVIDRTREETEKIDLIHSLEREREKGLNDYLTGVRNRDGFKKEVRQLMSGNGGQGVLLICDLDNFKQINDGLGHPEGDKVLKLFARCIRGQFRESDIVGRLGGDEFVVFLPGRIREETLREKLDGVMEAANEMFSDYRKYELGVSIGAGRTGSENGVTDFESLYESADSALYVAKQMGKNRYYINLEGIRCMHQACVHCREHCPRREALEKIIT